jgi:hypothetical protein
MVAFRDQNLENFLRRPAEPPRGPTSDGRFVQPRSPPTTTNHPPVTMTTIVTERHLEAMPRQASRPGGGPANGS